ncbi:flippase [Halogranum rubrum]|uniref:Membrane protein involved in the export of O-antigen and teichoic acid n=1 Tax=Halogranum salarium B-1 TaxID=1210908 RepID=J3JDZ5_9EURY|nr:flippase [Halogranum salarium]EJN57919.1 membrane protein involved in the export of O-antigen and teichoic acid [Halogranum salarium B-1]
MNIAKSSIKVFAGRTTSTIVVFLGITYFARNLGSHQMGVFFLFQALLGMLAIPADLGINGSVAKRISEGEPRGQVLSTALVIKFVPLSALVFGIFLLRTHVNEYVGAEIATLLVVAVILQEFAKLSIEFLSGELRVGETAFPALSKQVVFVGVGVILVTQGLGVFSLVYGIIIGLAVMLLWGAYKSSLSFDRPSISQARSLFDYSKYAFISSIGGYFYSWMDVAVIGFFMTQSDVGVYEIAWRVSAVLMLFSRSISTAIFPQISRWSADDATERIETLLPEVIAPSLLFVIPAFSGVALLSRDILGLIFGPEYTVGWVVLIILASEKLLQAVHIILGRSLQGIDRPDLAARAGIVAMVLNLVLNIVLVLEFGIVGAAVATAVSFVVNSALHAYYLSRFVSIRIPYTRIAGSIVASLGMCLGLIAARSTIAVDTLPRLLAAVFLGVLLYGGFVLLIPSLRSTVVDNARRMSP